MRLRQVLSNLIENAIKYGDDASTIYVTVRGENYFLPCAVKNKGLPIDSAALRTIFDPWRRNVGRGAKKDYGNSLGLGLYIVRQIVECNGGDIVAQSDPTETVFAFRLPQRPTAQELDA